MRGIVRAGGLFAVAVALAVAALLNATGADNRALPPNTWVNMQAGGVAAGKGVGDEGYNTFVYSPGLRKGIVFAQYHAVSVADGEDQNALLSYDFAKNRWDILEVTEAAWSEFLPGVGHDQGTVTIDPVNDLYITRGSQTLHGNTAYQTYIFDLKAGRGKRMLPLPEAEIGAEMASAFSPDHGIALTTRGGSWLYDWRKNVWEKVPRSPSNRDAPSLVYDRRLRVFVMFGGGFSDETWIFEPTTKVWSRRTPSVSPPARYAGQMAYDNENGIVLLVGGKTKDQTQLSDMWVYDAGTNIWTRLPVKAPPGSRVSSGNTLLYDSYHKVFLLKHGTDLQKVWAFRYVPAQIASRRVPEEGRSSPVTQPATGSSVDDGSLSASSAPRVLGTQRSAPPPSAISSGAAAGSLGTRSVDIPARTWIARRLPGFGKGPTDGKHQRAAFNPEDGRIYFLGGDWAGPGGTDSSRNEVYSYSIAEDRWYLEFPYCGPAGTVQPSGPDEVGWVFDTKRKLFWMLPGYLGGPPTNCPNSTFVRGKIMAFDPATRTWTETTRDPSVIGESTKFALYDPLSDTIIRFYFDGGSGMSSLVYDIQADKWTKTVHRRDRQVNQLNEARLGEEYAAIDVLGRRIWLIEPVRGKLYRYDIDTRELFFVTDTPVKNSWCGDFNRCMWPWASAMPIWDLVNKVLLWPHIPNFSQPDVTLYIYHPTKQIWERDKMIQPDGLAVRGNVAVFDPIQNAVLMMGRAKGHLFVYRYGTGPIVSGTR